MAVARKQTISTAELVELLIAAGVTDPLRWPAGLRDGAAYLVKIRDIERSCVERYGRWDAGLLDEELEDEYDDACALLDQLRRSLDSTRNVHDGE